MRKKKMLLKRENAIVCLVYPDILNNYSTYFEKSRDKVFNKVFAVENCTYNICSSVHNIISN